MDWPFKPRPQAITGIVIHHAGMDVPDGYATLESEAWYHIRTKHWESLAYHYVVGQQGEKWWANDDDVMTWHANDANGWAIGVEVLGMFGSTDEPDWPGPGPVQLAALKDLVEFLRRKHGKLKVVGHRDVWSTACPGLNFTQAMIDSLGEPMAYSTFPRPFQDTGAGVHSGANASFPLGENPGPQVATYRGKPVFSNWLKTCQDLRARGQLWLKIVTSEDSALACLPTVLYAGLMPVLRIYAAKPYIQTYSQKDLDMLSAYAALGGIYVEDDNERNLKQEWPDDRWPGSAMPFPELARAWCDRGMQVVGRGLKYAVPSLAPGGQYVLPGSLYEDGDDIGYLQNWLQAVWARPAARDILAQCWVSVHAAALNHPLNYPDDAVNQAEHPGQTIHTHYYQGMKPTGASNCWRKWEAVHKLVQDVTGLDLPIIITEGGAWVGNAADDRYPALDVVEASRRQFAMLHAMEQAPDYLLGNMPWLLSNRFYGNLNQGFEHDAWFRVPGYGNCPAYEPGTLPVWTYLGADPVRQRGGPVSDVAAIMGEELQHHIIPLNEKAAFEIAGSARGLLPAGPEFDKVVDGVTYRGQGYRDPDARDWQWLVFCKLNDWANLVWVKRAN